MAPILRDWRAILLTTCGKCLAWARRWSFRLGFAYSLAEHALVEALTPRWIWTRIRTSSPFNTGLSVKTRALLLSCLDRLRHLHPHHLDHCPSDPTLSQCRQSCQLHSLSVGRRVSLQKPVFACYPSPHSFTQPSSSLMSRLHYPSLLTHRARRPSRFYCIQDRSNWTDHCLSCALWGAMPVQSPMRETLWKWKQSEREPAEDWSSSLTHLASSLPGRQW